MNNICEIDVSLFLAKAKLSRVGTLIVVSFSSGELMFPMDPDKSSSIKEEHSWRHREDGKWPISALDITIDLEFGKEKQKFGLNINVPTFLISNL